MADLLHVLYWALHFVHSLTGSGNESLCAAILIGCIRGLVYSSISLFHYWL